MKGHQNILLLILVAFSSLRGLETHEMLSEVAKFALRHNKRACQRQQVLLINLLNYSTQSY